VAPIIQSFRELQSRSVQEPVALTAPLLEALAAASRRAVSAALSARNFSPFRSPDFFFSFPRGSLVAAARHDPSPGSRHAPWVTYQPRRGRPIMQAPIKVRLGAKKDNPSLPNSDISSRASAGRTRENGDVP